MRQTPNYNLPQFETNDKFYKEILNEAYDKIDTAISELQETVNNASGNAGVTAQEVVEARKGNTSLADRLDNDKKEIDSQLSDIETKNKWYCFVEEFGAKPNIAECQADKIQKAIDSGIGKVIFGQGTYYISKPLVLKRGTVLEGCSTVDTLPNATTIKLLPNSNCTMITTQFSIDGTKTHFYGLQNIRIEGSRLTQTEEHTCVDFRGAYVGSFLTNVAIRESSGRALELSNGCDVHISHLWINNIFTTSYAMTISEGVKDSSDGLIYMDTIYIENIINVNEDLLTKDVPEKRGKGLLIGGVVELNLQLLHFEGCSIPITMYGNSGVIKIPTISTAHCGNPKQSNSSVVFFEDGGAFFVEIGGIKTYNSNNIDKIIKKGNFTSNEFVEVGNTGTVGKWQYIKPGFARNFLARGTNFNNRVEVVKNGTFDAPSYDIINGSFTTRFKNKNDKSYVSMSDGVTENDLIEFRNSSNVHYLKSPEQFVLGIRREGEPTQLGGMYIENNTPIIGVGYNVLGNIATTIVKTYDATSYTPNYIGQLFINTSSRKVWISCGLTTSDWILLN